MIELGMYPVEWVVGEQEWPAFDIDANCPSSVELTAPQWVHEDGIKVLRKVDVSAKAVDVQG